MEQRTEKSGILTTQESESQRAWKLEKQRTRKKRETCTKWNQGKRESENRTNQDKRIKKGITVLRDRVTRRYGGQGDEDIWAVVNLLT